MQIVVRARIDGSNHLFEILHEWESILQAEKALLIDDLNDSIPPPSSEQEVS